LGLFLLLRFELATSTRTTPEVMGLHAGDTIGLSRGSLEALEEGPLPAAHLKDLEDVLSGENPVKTYFERVDWPLGLATAHMQSASWITRVKPNPLAVFELEQIMPALEGFRRAGDDAGVRLAQCRIMATAVDENNPLGHFIPSAGEIGVWGRDVGSFAFALGLGYFQLAVARRWRRRNNVAAAVLALTLASAIFEGLDAPVALADVAMEEADLVAANWEASEAAPLYQVALDRYVGVLLAMGIPRDEFLAAFMKLRQRALHASAHLAAAAAGRDTVARIRQQLIAAKILA
jgi:hypothetical protein